MNHYDYQELCSNFEYQGEYIGARRYGEGHINDTFLVETTGKRYILQRVNTLVFKEPEKLIENVVAVTEYHKPSSLNNKYLFLTYVEAGKIKVLEDSVSEESPLSDHRLSTFFAVSS